MTFCLPGRYSARSWTLFSMLKNTNSPTTFMQSGQLEVRLFMMLTAAWLSLWIITLEFGYYLAHKKNAIAIPMSSRKAMLGGVPDHKAAGHALANQLPLWKPPTPSEGLPAASV